MIEQQRTNLRQRLAKLIKTDYDVSRPRRGEVHEAVILDVGENDMIVDLGGKRDGIVPPKDLELIEESYVEDLEVGDTVPVVVMKTWGRRDGILVSINKGLQQQDWLRAEEYMEEGRVVQTEVTGFNRGGVVGPFGRLRGFVPNSHLTSIPPGLRGEKLRQAKADLVGKTLSLMIIEVKQRRRRLVLSERVADRHRREQLLDELSEGDIRVGTVRNLVDFGAFVDLGGIDGLIHISELDWKRVDHPRDVLDVGDELEVYVLNVDKERERIALSRKKLLKDPWHHVIANLHVGKVIEGTVTSVVSFGAFVDVGEGVEGLVHTSEMPQGMNAEEDIEPGARVQVRVLEIDEWQRRIGLRLEEIEEAPE